MKASLLHVPSAPFLTYVLAAARTLSRTLSNRNIIVCPRDLSGLVSPEMAEFAAVDAVMTENRMFETMRPGDIDLIMAHNENCRGLMADLIVRFPNAQRLLYADGFRNAFRPDSYRTVSAKHMVFFGLEHVRWKDSITTSFVIPEEDFHQVIELVARHVGLGDVRARPVEEKYSVFYTRYWGVGGYDFPRDLVARSWTQTIKAFSGTDETIVLKMAPAQPNIETMVREFEAGLREAGFRVENLPDFLERTSGAGRFGNQVTEVLMSAGFLTDAVTHYTLDSSLPHTMASSGYLKRPANIVIGARLWDELSSFEGARNGVLHNTAQQRHALSNSPACAPVIIKNAEGELPARIVLN